MLKHCALCSNRLDIGASTAFNVIFKNEVVYIFEIESKLASIMPQTLVLNVKYYLILIKFLKTKIYFRFLETSLNHIYIYMYIYKLVIWPTRLGH